MPSLIAVFELLDQSNEVIGQSLDLGCREHLDGGAPVCSSGEELTDPAFRI